MRIRGIYTFGLLALGQLPASVWGTSFYERPFPDSVKEAPVIVRGRVGSKKTDWVQLSDGSKRIYTFWELRIDELVKGDSSSKSSLVMRELGGEKDGVGMQVAGTAVFSRGEDVVVFLGLQNPDGSHDLHGMMMSKFTIRRREDGREMLEGAALRSSTHPGLRGHVLHGEEGHEGPSPRPDWSLEDLRDLVRRQANDGGAITPTPRKPRPTLGASGPPSTDSTGVGGAQGQASPLQTSQVGDPPPKDGGGIPGWALLLGVATLLTVAVIALALLRK